MSIRRTAAVAFCVVWAFAAVCPAAPTLSGVVITDSPSSGVIWDTFINGNVTSFVKDGSTFLNPSDQAISIDLANNGSYAFDLRLNKGAGREMSAFRFRLFFDGTPDNGTPGIDVTAARDTTGATPPFAGDASELLAGGKLFTLTSVRVSSFNPVDEVAEFAATPDGNIDYVGSFTYTVTPEPAAAAGLLMPLAGAAIASLLRRRRV